jgi:glucose dehydrogenase
MRHAVGTLLRRGRLGLAVVLLASVSLSADWPYYGGAQDHRRYSPLTQMTPENVRALRVARTYDTGDAFEGSEMRCQPVIARGVLYAASPKLRVFALDAATGAHTWSFNPDPDATRPSRTRIRGLMYWERGDDRRIDFAARHWLYALDARTGRLLWETTLPAAGTATPAVSEVDGKPFVVIGAGGGKWGAPSGGTYVALALP